jgi:hypothetical protein
MTTAATSLLGLALPVTGELNGTWGDTVNNSITSLLDSAIAGTTTISTDGDVTLTTTTLAANQAREAILLFSGARTAQRTVTAPAQSKLYTVINATTGGFAVKLVGAGPTTGLTIPAGASALVAWNGSDFVEIGATTINSLTVSGNLSVGGTTLLTGVATLTANPVLNGGTANGVAYLNGSKVLTTGSTLTFDGTNFGVGISPVSSYRAAVNGDYWQGNGAGAVIGTLINNGGWYELAGAINVTGLQFAHATIQRWMLGGSEQMRLTSTGLGIGTSSPQRKLHVNATPGATYGDVARFESNGAAGPVTLSFGDSGTSSALPTIGGNGNDLVFGTGAATQMRLTLAGNLGLGVTPSAWNAYKHIDVGAFNGIYGDNNSAFNREIGLYTNAYYSSGWKYAVTGSAANWFVAYNGTYAWNTAPSGTAGNAITFTQAMTLDASGNLLAGDTSNVFDSTVRLYAKSSGFAAFFRTTASSGYSAAAFSRDGNDGNVCQFYRVYNGSAVGSISVTASATAYNTSSDYRLKDITGPITTSGAYIDSLNPVEGTWKADGSTFVGLIAHEAQEASRTQVATGVKDGAEMQGMDYSSAEIIANLIAEIQSLRKRLAAAGI